MLKVVLMVLDGIRNEAIEAIRMSDGVKV